MKTNLTTSLVLDIFELLIRTEETLLPEHRPGGFQDVIDRLKKELNEQVEPPRYYIPKDSDTNNPPALLNPFNYPGLVSLIIGPNSWDWENKEVRYGGSSGLVLTTEQIETFKRLFLR